MRVGCPSEKLLALVKEVKSFTESPSRKEAAGSEFVLKCPEVVQPVNKQQLRMKRGQPAFKDDGDPHWGPRYVSDVKLAKLKASIPTELLYPWTKDGQACKIAGERVQLISTANVSLFVNAGCACNDMLQRMFKRNLGGGAPHVYTVLMRAINAVTTEPRFYAHSI